MSHQPFETWLFTNKSELNIEEKRLLYDHLQTCSSCVDLQQSWASIEYRLASARRVRPAEGFVQRWKISVEARREMEQRRQITRLLLSLSGAAFVILVLVAAQFVMTVSLLDWALSLMQEGLRFMIQSQKVFMLLINWVQRVPITVVLTGWLMVFGLFSSLSALWMLSLQQISNQGVVQR